MLVSPIKNIYLNKRGCKKVKVFTKDKYYLIVGDDNLSSPTKNFRIALINDLGLHGYWKLCLFNEVKRSQLRNKKLEDLGIK
jgi:hypothetical protein